MKKISKWEYRFYDRHSYRCEGIEKRRRKEKKEKKKGEMGKLSPSSPLCHYRTLQHINCMILEVFPFPFPSTLSSSLLPDTKTFPTFLYLQLFRNLYARYYPSLSLSLYITTHSQNTHTPSQSIPLACS